MNDLALTEIHSKVSEIILSTPAPGKHCARSSIIHIQNAWLLRDTDREMAVFRALTGEEESVTAIFHSLRRLNYVGSEKLNPRSHVHKAALHPFLAAIENNFYSAKMDQFKLAIEIDSNVQPPKVQTRATIRNEASQKFYIYPIPPLNFTVKLDGTIHNFAPELSQLTSQQTIYKVVEHIRSLANRRNTILYASSQGVPKVQDPIDDFLLRRRDKIFRNLTLYLLIDPYPVQQFVQQALDGFLEMLGLLPSEIGMEST